MISAINLIFKKFIVYFICCILVIPLCFVPAKAQAQADGVVRVAYVPPEIDSMEFVPVAQIFKAYMDEIAKYAGWKYTLFPVKADVVKEKLLKGEIDLVLPVEYYPDPNDSRIIYNRQDFLNDVLCFYYKADGDFVERKNVSTSSMDKYANNLLMVNNTRIGILASRENLVHFADFAKEHGLEVSISFYQTSAQVDAALMNGQVDLIVDTITRSDIGVKQLLAFETVPARVASTAINQDLVDQFDRALDAAWKEDEDTLYQLNNLFFEKAHIITTNFTADELHYIEMTTPIRLVLYGQYPPYVYLNENNEPSGIYPDILTELLRLTGLKYKFLFANSYDEAQTMLKSGLADVMIDIYNNDSSAPNFTFTNPFYEEKYTLVGMRETNNTVQDTFIVPHTLPSLLQFVQSHMPEHEVLSAIDLHDALGQANSNPKNIAMAEMLTLQSERILTMYPKLSTVPTMTLSVPLSFAISNHRQIILRSILNKAVQRMDHQTIGQIVLRHTMNNSQNLSLSYLMYYYPIHLGLGVCFIILMLTTSAFLFYNYQITKIQHNQMAQKNAELQKTLADLQEASAARDNYRHMAENDGLTGVYNKVGMEELCRHAFDTMKDTGTSYAFMIIDLDHFKQLNDTCGHQRGDTILKDFAKALRSIVRRNDLIGRFGGDEFVVLLHNVESISVVRLVADRINAAARSLNTGNDEVKISASIGIAIAPRDGTTYDSIFSRADESVYVVKDRGRDGYHIHSEM